MPAAVGLVLPAIRWLTVAISSYDSYAWKYGLEDNLIAFLHAWTAISRRFPPDLREPFLHLLATVVSCGTRRSVFAIGSSIRLPLSSPRRIHSRELGYLLSPSNPGIQSVIQTGIHDFPRGRKTQTISMVIFEVAGISAAPFKKYCFVSIMFLMFLSLIPSPLPKVGE